MTTKPRAPRKPRATADSAKKAVEKAKRTRGNRAETVGEAILSGHPTVSDGARHEPPREVLEELTFEQALKESGQVLSDLIPDDANDKGVHGDHDGKPRSAAAQHWLKYRQKYQSVKVEGDKKAHTNCGDKVAEILLNMSLVQIYEEVARRLGTTVPELQDKYAKLNPGMQRMNLGNRLRAILKKEAAQAK